MQFVNYTIQACSLYSFCSTAPKVLTMYVSYTYHLQLSSYTTEAIEMPVRTWKLVESHCLMAFAWSH